MLATLFPFSSNLLKRILIYIVASNIGAKLNNLLIFIDILVNFLRILSTKSMVFSQVLFFHWLQFPIANLLGQKNKFCHLWSAILVKILRRYKYFEYQIDHISKTKICENCIIVFSLVSEHCVTFWNKNPNWPLFTVNDLQTPPPPPVCISLTRKDPDIMKRTGGFRTKNSVIYSSFWSTTSCALLRWDP